MCEPCPYCQGEGRVKSTDTICLEILREVGRLQRELAGHDVIVRAAPAVGRALENESHAVLEGIRHMLNSPVQVLPDHSLHQERFEVTAR